MDVNVFVRGLIGVSQDRCRGSADEGEIGVAEAVISSVVDRCGTRFQIKAQELGFQPPGYACQCGVGGTMQRTAAQPTSQRKHS